MNLDQLYLFKSRKITESLSLLANVSPINIVVVDSLDEFEVDRCDGLVILTEGLDTDKHDQELLNIFESKRIPNRKVDLNGTLQVGLSSIELWADSNKCKSIAISGGDEILANEKFIPFLERLSQRIN